MTLYKHMVKTGDYLFKYRGQFPIILFIICIPIIAQTSYHDILPDQYQKIIKICAISISTLGLFCRYYITGITPENTSGRNRDKQIAHRLNKKGPYSIVRNPLYVANYIIWIGLSIYSLSYILCIIVTLLFIIHYERVIMAEEEFLLQKFKDEYVVFCKKTPAFFPKLENYKKLKYEFSIKKILRQEYSSTLSVIVTFIYIDFLMHYLFHLNPFGENWCWQKYTYILLISLIIAILLKIIRMKSDLLEG